MLADKASARDLLRARLVREFGQADFTTSTGSHEFSEKKQNSMLSMQVRLDTSRPMNNIPVRTLQGFFSGHTAQPHLGRLESVSPRKLGSPRYFASTIVLTAVSWLWLFKSERLLSLPVAGWIVQEPFPERAGRISPSIRHVESKSVFVLAARQNVAARQIAAAR